MRRHWLLALILILQLSRQALGQANDVAPTPLGDLAKKNKDTAKHKAKLVFNDDTVSLRSNPIPPIALTSDNTGAILDTIHDVRKTRTAADAERLVHDWFDEETSTLSAIIEANLKLAHHNQIRMETLQDGYAYPRTNDGDFSKLQQSQLSERWSQRSDGRTAQEINQTISRIQQTLVKVRCDLLLNRGKTAYDWFRIPATNGLGTY